MIYEVWRYCEYDRGDNVYKRQELLYTSDKLTGARLAMAIFELGRMSSLREMTPKMNSTVDTDGGHAKFGVEFVDSHGNPEYWCVVENKGDTK